MSSSSSSSQNQNTPPQDATAALRSATFSTGQNSVSDNNAVTASDLLAGAFDPARLHPMADLKENLEYLILEDDKTTDVPGATTALPSRGWSDDLCYGTGTTYLSGKHALFLCLSIMLTQSLLGSLLRSSERRSLLCRSGTCFS